MKLYFNISKGEQLSEKLIYKFEDLPRLSYILRHQIVSEKFIEQFINDDTILTENNWALILTKNDWNLISKYQCLSEQFIEKYKDKVDWYNISKYQKLSESFIEKYINYVNLYNILIYQHLSENFIKKHICEFDLYDLIKYQKLSKNFINNFIDKYKDVFILSFIGRYQKLSDKIIKDNNITIDEDNWLYKDTEFKKKQIVDSGLYECYDDYFIAYKAIRQDRYSLYNFQYKYEPGKIYESTCDCTNEEDSFGLNIGTHGYAKWYGDDNCIIIKCKVKYEDVGRLANNNNKVRCFKIEILD